MKENKLIILLAVILLGGLLFLALRGRVTEQVSNQEDEQAGVAFDSDETDGQQNFYIEGEAVLDPESLGDEDVGGEVEGITSADDQSPTDSNENLDSTAIAKYVFFYGDTCPYCHDVIDWMDDTGVESMLDITRKEVYNDPKNSEQMNLAVRSCSMSQSGVPMMYTSDKECIVGSTPIIDHLSEVAGI